MTYPQQQGGYGPPPPPGGGYGYPPPVPGGFGQYPPPRKNNTGLIVGVVGIVMVAVVALVLVLVLTGDDDSSTADGSDTSEESGPPNGIPGPNGGDSGDGDDPGGASSPEILADLAVEVIETQDADLIDEHACSSGDASRMKSDLARLKGLDAAATLDDIQESGDTAQATVVVLVGGEPEAVLTVDMDNNSDTWCVSGIEITH
ncbi:MAG: hypothetical protein WBA97_17520 [Actinophytocola sp.]|uniref:hypothetical protein n=1 Tax=Actinophytocola sp. TaxID=1872138 RepID=UPI003C757447